MKTQDEYMVCSDCIMPIAYSDFTGLDYYYSEDESEQRKKEIEQGMVELANSKPNGYIVIGDDRDEFSQRPCDCCGTYLHGERHGVNVI